MHFTIEQFVMSAVRPQNVIGCKTPRDSILTEPHHLILETSRFLTWLLKIFFLLRPNLFIACKAFIHLQKKIYVRAVKLTLCPLTAHGAFVELNGLFCL